MIFFCLHLFKNRKINLIIEKLYHNEDDEQNEVSYGYNFRSYHFGDTPNIVSAVL